MDFGFIDWTGEHLSIMAWEKTIILSMCHDSFPKLSTGTIDSFIYHDQVLKTLIFGKPARISPTHSYLLSRGALQNQTTIVFSESAPLSPFCQPFILLSPSQRAPHSLLVDVLKAEGHPSHPTCRVRLFKILCWQMGGGSEKCESLLRSG
ncbi:hypothetical protein AVEN_13935-1 [Araneus ventricosus]|uniref:Uncharacterized protein n=1 Tax=Araneus ventricosus TaxID=182803 RepID=A0A4Y2U7I9_ARAVE|nr:hypothetical protein AVEN_13935-1 [Araneus ventricosus]